MDNYVKTKKDIIKIDEETILDTKNSTFLMKVTISDIINHYYNKGKFLFVGLSFVHRLVHH